MIWALLVAGVAVWVLGGLTDLIFGSDRLGVREVPYVLGILGGVAASVVGGISLTSSPRSIGLGSAVGIGGTSLRLDGLSGLFLCLAGGLSVLISACMVGWVQCPARKPGRGVAAGYLLLLGSVVLVVVAGDAFTFLFGWEALTLAFFLLTSVSGRDRSARSGWVTLAMGKASGAALLLGFLLLAGRSGTLSMAAWTRVGPGPLRDSAYALLVAGFGTKVGLVPFQLWLPLGYPAAPGPARAAMAGLAANAGFYGLWRLLAMLGPPPLWLVILVLVLGGITALGGITFAAVQSRLSLVVAYSSVENAGVILVGYGIALAGKLTHQPDLLAVGLVAASLQVLAHAVAKSTLFASAAFFEPEGSGGDLERLRGVGYTHRLSGACFAVGSVTLAGLPPTIGFVSEWFILEALLQEFRVPSLALRLAMASAGALVALTAGVAALTFVRLLGLMILSRPPRRTRRVRVDGAATHPARDAGIVGGTGIVGLAAACLALAAISPWAIRVIARGVSPVVGTAVIRGALRSPWVLQPVFANFSVLSPSWLFLVMPMALTATTLLVLAASRGGIRRLRRVPAWRSATAGIAGAASYTSFGYANPLRHVLANILGSGPVETATVDSAVESDGAHLRILTRIVEPVETYLYRPVGAGFLWLARAAKRVQSGRLDAYVAYMLFALVVSLTIVAALR